MGCCCIGGGIAAGGWLGVVGGGECRGEMRRGPGKGRVSEEDGWMEGGIFTM